MLPPQKNIKLGYTGVENVVKAMKMKLLRKSYGFSVINASHGFMETILGLITVKFPKYFQ